MKHPISPKENEEIKAMTHTIKKIDGIVDSVVSECRERINALIDAQEAMEKRMGELEKKENDTKSLQQWCECKEPNFNCKKPLQDTGVREPQNTEVLRGQIRWEIVKFTDRLGATTRGVDDLLDAILRLVKEGV